MLLADSNEAAARETLEMIAAEGGEAAVQVADVTDGDSCAAMVAAAISRWGRLDILDNNVGISGAGSVVQVPMEEWERVLRVNVLGMVNASKHAIPAMVESGGGSIINISSISALRPRGLTPYSTSKGAVIALTRASPLRIEGTGWDIGYTALFLASDEARYITGVVIPVDGGVTIMGPSR